MRTGTAKKYKAIQHRFKVIHEEKRLRLDDCVEKIMEEFFIEHKDTVWRILRTTITEKDLVKDPNQVSMFEVEGFESEEA